MEDGCNGSHEGVRESKQIVVVMDMVEVVQNNS